MKPETAINSCIGVIGTAFSWLTTETAGIFAGLATGCYMLFQVAAGVWDRRESRRRGAVHFPPTNPPTK